MVTRPDGVPSPTGVPRLNAQDQIDISPCGSRLIFRGEHRCQGYSPIALYATHTLASSRAAVSRLQSLSPGRQRVSRMHVSEVGISTYWGESARSHRARLFRAVWKSPWTLSVFIFTTSMRVLGLERVTPAFLFPERQWLSKAGVVKVLWLRPCAHTRVSIVCCSVLQCVAVCCSVLQCVAVCCSVLLLGVHRVGLQRTYHCWNKRCIQMMWHKYAVVY